MTQAESIIEERVCTKCGESYPTTEEYFNLRVWNGKERFHSWCRECQKKYGREYYKKNPEKIKEYFESIPEYLKEKRREWCKKNKEKIKEKGKQYREKNKEYLKEKRKEYREKNKERIKKYQEGYREKNKEKVMVKKTQLKIQFSGPTPEELGFPNDESYKNQITTQLTNDFSKRKETKKNAICVICMINPIQIKKWKLCSNCYGKLYRNRELNQLIPNKKVKKVKVKNTRKTKQTKQNHVGKSGTTPFKQTDLQDLLSAQIAKAYAVFKKHGNKDWYNEEDTYFIDCSSGDMNSNEITSPEILLRTLCNYYDLPSKLYLIERDKKTFSVLKENYQLHWQSQISQMQNMRVILKNTEMEECLFDIAPNKYRFGLLYFDPNGGTKDDYATIGAFLRDNPRIDVILNINTIFLKWLRGIGIGNKQGFEKYKDFYLSAILNYINRENIWIRDNIQVNGVKDYSKFEFVMVFGTNMPNYCMGSIKHFVPLNSFEGQQLLYKYNYTKAQKEEIENGKKYTN